MRSIGGPSTSRRKLGSNQGARGTHTQCSRHTHTQTQDSRWREHCGCRGPVPIRTPVAGRSRAEERSMVLRKSVAGTGAPNTPRQRRAPTQAGARGIDGARRPPARRAQCSRHTHRSKIQDGGSTTCVSRWCRYTGRTIHADTPPLRTDLQEQPHARADPPGPSPGACFLPAFAASCSRGALPATRPLPAASAPCNAKPDDFRAVIFVLAISSLRMGAGGPAARSAGGGK